MWKQRWNYKFQSFQVPFTTIKKEGSWLLQPKFNRTLVSSRSFFDSIPLSQIFRSKIKTQKRDSSHSCFSHLYSTPSERLRMENRTRNSLLWFRKGLRLHDNPALLEAIKDDTEQLLCVFVLDPWFLKPEPAAFSPGSVSVGVNRIAFLLESLQDLDSSLRIRGSQLLILQGNPKVVIPTFLKKWNIRKLCFEYDSEPYALNRDASVCKDAKELGVDVFAPISHTLFSPADTIAKNKGKTPLTYQSFTKLQTMKPPLPAPEAPKTLPPTLRNFLESEEVGGIPTLEQLGYSELQDEEKSPFRGGETEALERLEKYMAKKKWVVEFEKPKGDPSAFLEPSTTVLSPYLKFGCLSSRLFHKRIMDVYKDSKGKHTKPPVSLEGQLLWREFFYTAAFGTPNFDKMIGNPICKQIPWREDEALFSAWRDAKTGYPWIDAAMTQLRTWGWMHHLARHSVACFLTRGDMMIHWEKGRDVFDRLLLDSDWSINNGNWMWLSCSAFFAQYHRIYSPIAFGKKYDPQGKYIRHFLPVLKDMPAAFIYEPWTAPMEIQRKANCIVGKDYPQPVVDHAEANKLCRDRMGESYAVNKKGHVSSQELDRLRIKFYGDCKTSTSVAVINSSNSRNIGDGSEGVKKTKRQKTLDFKK